VDADAFLQLSPEALRERVPAFVAEPVKDASLQAVISAELAELVASWSDSDVALVRDAVGGVGVERRLYTGHPLLRQAVRIWSGHVLAGSTLEGIEHLSAAATAGPTAVVCNHASYMDSSAIDTILYAHAPDRLADRLVSAAGPKVYEGLFRRLVSASLNTIPVPQSATLGHTARLPGRDLARQSLEAVAQSHAAMQNGYVLLIYPEGARTRTGRMQLIGTAKVIGVGERGVRPGGCALRFGPPIDAEKGGGPREALARAESAVGELLPPELRPEEALAEAGS